MNYRQLGASGLRVPELCLGTMTFGHGFMGIGVVGQDEATAMVKAALDAGVDFFDTADVYSRGQAEEVLSRSLKALGVARERVVIATKVRGTMSDEAAAGTGDLNNFGLGRKHIIQAAEASLRRLGTDYVDLYQIHGFDPLTPWEETLGALNDLVRSGKALYVGACNLAARQLAKALGTSERRGWSGFVSLQAYYSLVARDLEHELLPLAREEGLGVLTWSPLSGGYLSGKYRAGTPDAGRRSHFDFPRYAANGEDALEVLEEVAKSRGESMATVALAWLRQQPGVTSVIIGATRPEQLAENLRAADLELSPEELEQLGAPTRPEPMYPQWMIQQQSGGGRPRR
jgi:aryl-alcohol dehydrogenase-like predicted oxidoreductase